MSFSISRSLPAAFLPPPSCWGCGVPDEAVVFDPVVTVGTGRFSRVITVGVAIDVEVMRMSTGVSATGVISVVTTTGVEVVSGVILMDVVVVEVVVLVGEGGAVELCSTVVGGGLGLVPETILKSALYTIDCIGTWETKRRILFRKQNISRIAMTNARSKTH